MINDLITTCCASTPSKRPVFDDPMAMAATMETKREEEEAKANGSTAPGVPTMAILATLVGATTDIGSGAWVRNQHPARYRAAENAMIFMSNKVLKRTLDETKSWSIQRAHEFKAFVESGERGVGANLKMIAAMFVIAVVLPAILTIGGTSFPFTTPKVMNETSLSSALCVAEEAEEVEWTNDMDCDPTDVIEGVVDLSGYKIYDNP